MRWWCPLAPLLPLHHDDERFVAFDPRRRICFLGRVPPDHFAKRAVVRSSLRLSAVAFVSSFTWHTAGEIILDVPSVIADFTVLPASPCPRVPGAEPLAPARLSAGSVAVGLLR